MRFHLLLRAVLPLTVLSVFGSGSFCLGGGSRECEANCDIEEECGFRTLTECQARSCDQNGDLIAPNTDACLAAAADCAEAAACACDEGCAAVDLCAGSQDATCPDTCDQLVEQAPEQTYVENRCRIESSCEDIAACSQVSG